MRPIHRDQVERAIRVTAPYVRMHGAPLYHGEATALGIADLDQPDYGDNVCLYPEELPVFWACGITTHQAVLSANVGMFITHAPGKMLITDVPSIDIIAPKTNA